jgi:hypothetical protein
MNLQQGCQKGNPPVCVLVCFTIDVLVLRQWTRMALKRGHTPFNDEFGSQYESGFGRRQIDYPVAISLVYQAFDRNLALKPIFVS